MSIRPESLDALFGSLQRRLEGLGAAFEIVAIGGSALQAWGFIDRATRDVDLVALLQQGRLRSAEPLPDALKIASDGVAGEFGIPEDWLNAGPTGLLEFGLPDGFRDRVRSQTYGPALTVHFAGRLDLIYFKLYAMVDQGAGRHEADLRSLQPTDEELLAAARWARTHDPSSGFLSVLKSALRHLGVTDGDLGD